MIRRMQKKEVQEKKVLQRVALKQAADSELNSEQIDYEELEKIRKRQEGHMVTMETFMKWKQAFDEEMAQKSKKDLQNVSELRYTGKQYFLLGLDATNNSSGAEEAMIQEGEGEASADGLVDVEGDEEEYDEEDDSDYVDDEEDDDDEDYEDEDK